MSGALAAGCALGGHHGVFAEVTGTETLDRHLLPAEFPAVGPAAWADARASVLAELAAQFEAQATPLEGSPSDWVLFAGLTVVSDWLASQELTIGDPASWPDWNTVPWAQHAGSAASRSQGIVAAAGLVAPTFRVSMSFPDTFGFDENDLQDTLSRHIEGRRLPGFTVVTVPMGAGKTEASLRCAQLYSEEGRGVFVALPTMATADAMFGRVVDYANRAAAVPVQGALWHSLSGLNESYLGLPADGDQVSDEPGTPVVASQWLRGRKRTLLSSVAAGTIDQLLAAVLPSKFSYLRWFGLAAKTVVIDEAHSLTPYMQSLLETALKWLGALGVPVVVLSATLPQHVSMALARAWCVGAGVAPPEEGPPYPGWLHVDASGSTPMALSFPEVTLHVEHNHVNAWDNDTSLAEAVVGALDGVDRNGCGLVVANTVTDAQRIYRILGPWAANNGVELDCLHSRMRVRDRALVTARVVDRIGKDRRLRPDRFVLVSTQVVEQSLDVDFDIVVSTLAPAASLLQRAGRGHRHPCDRSALPAPLRDWRLVVLVPGTDSLDVPRPWTYVYPKPYLQRTIESLPAGPLAVPGGVQEVVEAVYSTLDNPGEDPEIEQLVVDEWAERQQACRSSIPAPGAVDELAQLTSPHDDSILSTRLGVSTVNLLILDPGAATLDGLELPEHPNAEQVRWILGACVPLRPTAALLALRDHAEQLRPETWDGHSLLSEVLVALPSPDGTITIGSTDWVLADSTGWQHA